MDHRGSTRKAENEMDAKIINTMNRLRRTCVEAAELLDGIDTSSDKLIRLELRYFKLNATDGAVACKYRLLRHHLRKKGFINIPWNALVDRESTAVLLPQPPSAEAEAQKSKRKPERQARVNEAPLSESQPPQSSRPRLEQEVKARSKYASSDVLGDGRKRRESPVSVVVTASTTTTTTTMTNTATTTTAMTATTASITEQILQQTLIGLEMPELNSLLDNVIEKLAQRVADLISPGKEAEAKSSYTPAVRCVDYPGASSSMDWQNYLEVPPPDRVENPRNPADSDEFDRSRSYTAGKNESMASDSDDADERHNVGNKKLEQRILSSPPEMNGSDEGPQKERSSRLRSPSPNQSSDDDEELQLLRIRRPRPERKPAEGVVPRGRPDSRAAKCLQTWDIKFSNIEKEDPQEYLDDVDACQRANRLADDDVLDALYGTFRGDAKLWYRNEQSNIHSLQEFTTAFRKRFLRAVTQERLEEDLKCRKQGRDEDIDTFIACMRRIISEFRKPPRLTKQLKWTMRNLTKEYRQFIITRGPIETLDDIIAYGRDYELFNEYDAEEAAPRPASKMAVRSAAWVPKKTIADLAAVEQAVEDEKASTSEEDNESGSDTSRKKRSRKKSGEQVVAAAEVGEPPPPKPPEVATGGAEASSVWEFWSKSQPRGGLEGEGWSNG